MPKLITAVILASAVALCRWAPADESSVVAPELCDAGWQALFDGRSLDGWQVVGEAAWEVVDGTIRTGGERPGWLMTTGEYADFELHVEFRAAATTNSGIFLRTPLEPTDPANDCYELNIAPAENPFPTGSLVARKKVSWAADDFPAPDQWHAFDFTAAGGKFVVGLNGEPVLEYDDPGPIGRGRIGLQSNQGGVAFRKIRIRTLPR